MLTQRGMASLFDIGIDNVNVHLKNIYNSLELNEKSTFEEISIFQQEGSRKLTKLL